MSTRKTHRDSFLRTSGTQAPLSAKQKRFRPRAKPMDMPHTKQPVGSATNSCQRAIHRAPKMRQIIVGMLLIISWLIVGCDAGHSVTFENRTDRPAIVFEGRAESIMLPPNSSEKLSVLEYDGYETFSVRDEAGSLLFSASLTWQDLEEMNWTIIVVDPELEN